MNAYDYKTIYHHSFIFNTRPKAIDDNIPIDFPRKNINPIYHSAGDEMYFFLVSDDVTLFHNWCFIKDRCFLEGSKSETLQQRECWCMSTSQLQKDLQYIMAANGVFGNHSSLRKLIKSHFKTSDFFGRIGNLK